MADVVVAGWCCRIAAGGATAAAVVPVGLAGRPRRLELVKNLLIFFMFFYRVARVGSTNLLNTHF